MRFRRTWRSSYSGVAADSIAVDPANNNAPLTLSTGIPAAAFPTAVNGFASLPVSGGTVTVKKDFHRGYIESWNAFLQRDLGAGLVANLGYVGTHQVRQLVQTGFLNRGSSAERRYAVHGERPLQPVDGFGRAMQAFQANETINEQFCNGTGNLTCYNTGGIGEVEPLFSTNYNGCLQAQLTRNAGKNGSFGLNYTWS